jgi:carbonic anhydrase
MATLSPAQAWQELGAGNERFVAGRPDHPNQDAGDRERLTAGQQPKAVLLGCSDSRVAAEIVFDQGLGDLFVVRTAGHTLDSAVLGSIEYATAVLEVPLIAILGHDRCGAVGATLKAIDEQEIPPGHIRDVVERVTPSVLAGRRDGLTEAEDFVARHVEETGRSLVARSPIVADAVAGGRLGIVGLTYRLADGRVTVRDSLGDIGAESASWPE